MLAYKSFKRLLATAVEKRPAASVRAVAANCCRSTWSPSRRSSAAASAGISAGDHEPGAALFDFGGDADPVRQHARTAGGERFNQGDAEILGVPTAGRRPWRPQAPPASPAPARKPHQITRSSIPRRTASRRHASTTRRRHLRLSPARLVCERRPPGRMPATGGRAPFLDSQAQTERARRGDRPQGVPREELPGIRQVFQRRHVHAQRNHFAA